MGSPWHILFSLLLIINSYLVSKQNYVHCHYKKKHTNSRAMILIIINLLLRKFSKCSVGVKCFLFKTYYSNLYFAPMWFDCTKVALKKLKIATTTACDDLCSYHGVIEPLRC